MKSLYELFIIILYIYFGSFSCITFMIIFYFQKKMKIIKALLLFSFFAYLIIIRKFATQKDCISEFAAYKTVDNNHKFL